jgi:predicted MFS family arabinose efflux permease
VTRPGRRAWLAVAGAALALGLLYLSVFAVPPLITTFVDELGLSHPQAGALMSVMLGGFLVTSMVSGRLTARFGPARLIACGLILGGVASACFGLADAYPAFLVCRAALGVAIGLVYAPGITYVASLVSADRANLGIGVFLCGLSTGAVISFFSTRLLADAFGWRWPFWIFGAAALVGAAAFRAFAGGGSRRVSRAPSVPMREVLANHAFRLLLVALFAGMFVVYGVFTWVAPYLDESAGFSPEQVSVASALMALTGIPASLGSGWLASRSGKPLSVSIAGHCLPLLLIAFALESSPSLAGATAVATISAFGVAFGNSPLYAAAPTFVDRAASGTASGLAAAAGMAGAITSTYAGGWIVGGRGYGAAFAVYAIAAATLALLLVPLTARRLRRPREALPAR